MGAMPFPRMKEAAQKQTYDKCVEEDPRHLNLEKAAKMIAFQRMEDGGK